MPNALLKKTCQVEVSELERMKQNQKVNAWDPNIKAGIARTRPDTAALKTGPFSSFTFVCMSASALPFRPSLPQRL